LDHLNAIFARLVLQMKRKVVVHHAAQVHIMIAVQIYAKHVQLVDTRKQVPAIARIVLPENGQNKTKLMQMFLIKHHQAVIPAYLVNIAQQLKLHRPLPVKTVALESLVLRLVLDLISLAMIALQVPTIPYLELIMVMLA
jgi:hypothetical protein